MMCSLARLTVATVDERRCCDVPVLAECIPQHIVFTSKQGARPWRLDASQVLWTVSLSRRRQVAVLGRFFVPCSPWVALLIFCIVSDVSRE